MPANLAGVVAGGLPVAELVCAALLVAGDPGTSAGAVLSILLLVSFTIAIVVNLLRGRRPDCHCFGQLSSAPTGWPTVVRNGALLVLALLPLGAAGDLLSVPAQLASYSAQDLVLGLVIGGLVFAVAVLGILFRTLMGRYGAVLVRLEALESSTGAAFEPRPAPSFELPDLNGAAVALVDVIAQQRPVLLVFISPDCTICAELLPDLRRWQNGGEPMAVVVVSTGSVSSNRAKLASVPGLRVLLQVEREVEQGYGLQGTPGAFLLGTDGMIAAAAAYGVEPIRALYESANSAMTPNANGHQHLSDLPDPLRAAERPVRIGDAVPAVEVQTEAGLPLDLAELTDAETMLLFWDPSCGFCGQIAADVAALEVGTSVLLVSCGDPGAVRASGLTSPLVRDADFTVGNALQVPGTPAAVLVRQRTTQSEVAVGGPEVLALLLRHAHPVCP